jgi:hypothetical protein
VQDTLIKLTRTEIQEKIPYTLIGKVMWGTKWETEECKIAWYNTFSDKERLVCERLGRQSYRWYLAKSVPESYVLQSSAYDLWLKLAEFCASV